MDCHCVVFNIGSFLFKVHSMKLITLLTQVTYYLKIEVLHCEIRKDIWVNIYLISDQI